MKVLCALTRRHCISLLSEKLPREHSMKQASQGNREREMRERERDGGRERGLKGHSAKCPFWDPIGS